MGEVMGEESHPPRIIQKQARLSVDVPCRALVSPFARPRRGYYITARPALHILEVCEGMSDAPPILLVAAAVPVQRTLAAALRSRGFECETVTGVKDAQRKLETGGHEVAVVNLDAASAFDLFRARRRDGLPVSVIAITERPAAATAVQAFRAGAVDYLSKPIQRDELLAAVERGIEKASALRRLRGADQLVAACVRWFRDTQTLLAVPGAWTLPAAIREALVESRDAGALDQVLIRCLGAHEVGALTRRERDVLLAFAQGQRGRDLARCLRISVNTCRTHVKSMLKKLGCHSQRELLARLGGTPRASD